MRLNRLSRLWTFDRRRFTIFAVLLTAIFVFVIFGISYAIVIPLIGTFLFFAALKIWFAPDLLFGWTGFFVYYEYGAAPSGVAGYVVMFLFYAAVATVVTWPFAPKRE